MNRDRGAVRRDGIDARRRGVVAGVGALAGTTLAGCAVPAMAPRPGGPSLGRVVVVGGGYGGATAARYLRLWGHVDVTLVEREPRFVSCPMSNLVLGGYRRIDDVTLGYDALAATGVRIVRGDVVAVDVDARRVRLADGSALGWDRLVVSPGVDFIPGAIGGLDAAQASGAVLHAWKAGAQTVALRRQLEALPDGGVVAISIPRMPYRCPPGPYERACIVASWLKVHRPRSKLLVLDANPEITSKKALFETAFRDRYAGLLEYRPDAELREVDGTLARLEFEDVRADVLNVVPPQRAGAIALQAGLVTINGRWAGVDWRTLESTAVPRVHVLGDAVFPAPLMPKSGHMANQHAKVAAAAILKLLAGESVDPAPMMTNTCYSFVAPREAMHVASVHRYDATERTMLAVPGSGGVSAAASELEGRIADGWARTIWSDTLALPPAA